MTQAGGLLGAQRQTEDQVMEHFIQLNLQSDSDKAKAANLPRPEHNDPATPEFAKRVNRFVNRAAHKAATEFGKNGSGIFSK
jgi:hypothetical protein